ncbi:MAG TPA: VOC family protein [Acidobacteriaceae bacterium]|nr:VOC family protein [Acidobacteriaceae bacterium]
MPTKDTKSARKFYEKQLGLTFLREDPGALIFDSNGTAIRVIQIEPHVPAPFSILGWSVDDVRDCAERLHENGIELQRYPGLEQDALGIWTSPGGSLVAWFTDADGNVLSITEG